MSGKHTCQHQQPEEKHQCCEKLFGSLVLVMGLILKPWRSEHSNIWNVGFWKACLKGFCHNHIQDESSNPFCSLKCRCFSRNVPRATVDLQQIYTLRGRSDRPPTESFSIWVFLIWQKLLSEAAHKKSLLFSEDRCEMQCGGVEVNCVTRWLLSLADLTSECLLTSLSYCFLRKKYKTESRHIYYLHLLLLTCVSVHHLWCFTVSGCVRWCKLFTFCEIMGTDLFFFYRPSGHNCSRRTSGLSFTPTNILAHSQTIRRSF